MTVKFSSRFGALLFLLLIAATLSSCTMDKGLNDSITATYRIDGCVVDESEAYLKDIRIYMSSKDDYISGHESTYYEVSNHAGRFSIKMSLPIINGETFILEFKDPSGIHDIVVKEVEFNTPSFVDGAGTNMGWVKKELGDVVMKIKVEEEAP